MLFAEHPSGLSADRTRTWSPAFDSTPIRWTIWSYARITLGELRFASRAEEGAQRVGFLCDSPAHLRVERFEWLDIDDERLRVLLEKPDGDDAAVDDDDRGQPALVAVDAFVEARLDEMILDGVREQEGVERRQQRRRRVGLAAESSARSRRNTTLRSPSTVTASRSGPSRSNSGLVTLVGRPDHFEKSRWVAGANAVRNRVASSSCARPGLIGFCFGSH